MAQYIKASALPDLDNAPDVYETPESPEVLGARSPSVASSRTSLSDNDDISSGISKSGINRNSARSAFKSTRLDAKAADFSDRLVGVGRSRRSYRVRHTGYGLYNNDKDDDFEVTESKEERLARLAREVEELKADMAKGNTEVEADQRDQTAQKDVQVVNELGKVLRELQQQAWQSSKSAKQPTTTTSMSTTQDLPIPADTKHIQLGETPMSTMSTESIRAVEHHTSNVLARATALEARLVALETLLGPSVSMAPSAVTTSIAGSHKPILSHLNLLDKQMTILTSTTPSQLDAMSSQIQQLLNDTQRLTTARQSATTALKTFQAQRSMGMPRSGTDPSRLATTRHGTFASTTASRPVSRGANADTAASPTEQQPQQLLEDPEHLARVEKLYSSLPNIEAILPLVPAVVERLRTLKTVHADAASARQDLKELEKRQGDMALELTRWREGLEKVEAAVRDGMDKGKENKESIETWVKELEGRMTRLGQ